MTTIKTIPYDLNGRRLVYSKNRSHNNDLAFFLESGYVASSIGPERFMVLHATPRVNLQIRGDQISLKNDRNISSEYYHEGFRMPGDVESYKSLNKEYTKLNWDSQINSRR